MRGADVIYDRLSAIWDTKAMSKWMGNCLEESLWEFVKKLQLQPSTYVPGIHDTMEMSAFLGMGR